MHNCIILGSGRSGTSMVAGCLAKSGYYFGDNLIPPREANKKGFFESPFINLDINEAILNYSYAPVKQGRWWLSEFPFDIPLNSTHVIRKNIRKVVSNPNYCYKDPRFCYTLPIWRPFLKDGTKFICVFRHPISTVSSMIKECNTALYLKEFEFNYEKAYSLWSLMYKHVMERHRNKGEWLFVHYDQMFQKSGLDKLSKFLNVEVDILFPEKKMKREILRVKIPEKVSKIYSSLCELANYT